LKKKMRRRRDKEREEGAFNPYSKIEKL